MLVRTWFCLLVVIIIMPIAALSDCSRETEANDSPGLSCDLGVVSGRSCMIGAIAVGNDVDYYRLQMESSCTVIVTVKAWGKLIFSLYDKDGEWINGELHSGTSTDSRLVCKLEPGVYYARVEGVYGEAAGRYQISISAIPYVPLAQCTEEHEINDELSCADALVSHNGMSCRKAAIDPANDRDVYWFELPVETFAVVDICSQGDTLLYLYDENGTYVADDDSGGSGSASRLSLNLQSGRYYASVLSFGRDFPISEYGIYLMQDVRSTDTLSQDCPWGYQITGEDVLFSAWGKIDPHCSSDEDFAEGLWDIESYSFSVPSIGYVALALVDEPEQWLQGEILDEFGYSITEKKGAAKTIYSEWARVPPGEYVIEVKPGKWTDQSLFELHVLFSEEKPASDYLIRNYLSADSTLQPYQP